MTPKSKNILVGLFVIILTGGMATFITWLGMTTVREESDIYIVYLEEAVSGLSDNSPVKYKGVTIGMVEKIGIDPKNSNLVELRLRINRGTPIKVDSRAILTSRGITGLQYVEITGGNQDMPLLETKPSEVYPVIPAGKSTLATVEAAIGPMLSNINSAIQDIHQILSSAKPQHLEKIVADVQQFTGALAGSALPLTQAMQDLQKTLKSLQQIVENAESLFNSPHLEKTLGNVSQISTNLNQMLSKPETQNLLQNTSQSIERLSQLLKALNTQVEKPEFSGLVGDLRKTLQESQGLIKNLRQTTDETDLTQVLQEFKVTLQEIQALSQKLSKVSEGLENNPSSVIFGGAKQEIRVRP